MERTEIALRADIEPNKQVRRAVVILFLIAAATLRLVALDRYPTPLHQDELSDIYDGYSIATTGADRAGDAYPILLRGMGPGDYHPGLYAYLATVSTWLGGLSVWWGRLPAALAGIATVWLVYATGRRILGDTGALLALAFMTFSPIHIQYSRQAHQGACLVPLFVILCTYTCIRAIDRICSSKEEPHSPVAPVSFAGPLLPPPFTRGDRGGSSRAARAEALSMLQVERVPHPRYCEGGEQNVERAPYRPATEPIVCPAPKFSAWSTKWSAIFLCGLVLGFSTNGYAGQRLTALLFSLFVLALLLAHALTARNKWKQTVGIATAFTLAVALGAAPQIYAAITDPAHFFARGATTFFRLSNGPRWWLETMGANLFANLDPRYLFLSFGEYHVLSIARLAAITLPFLYVGLFVSCIRPIIHKRIDLALIPAAIVFSLLPGLATEGQPSPMRTSGVWALYPIVAAQGAIILHQLLTRALSSLRRTFVSHGCPILATARVGDGFLGHRVPLLCEQWSSLRERSERGGSADDDTHPQGDRRRWSRSVWTASLLLGIAANGIHDVHRYLAAPALHARAAQPQFVALGNWVREHGANYDRIYVSADGLFGYLYLAAFSGMTCNDYKTAPRDSTVIGLGWDDYAHFGRFFFQPYAQAEKDWSTSAQKEKWLVLTAEGPLAEFGPAIHASLVKSD